MVVRVTETDPGSSILLQIETLIRADVALRDGFFRKAIEVKRGQLAARGVLRSGMARTAFQELYEVELRDRAEVIVTRVRNTLQTLSKPLEALQRASLQQLAVRLFTEDAGMLEALLGEETCRTSDERPSDFLALVTTSVGVINSEIGLMFHGMRRRAKDTSSTVFNIHGSVGAIQTGDHSTAAVNLSLGDVERQRLLDALDMVETKLKDLAFADRTATHEVISDLRSEITRQVPNRFKLTGPSLPI